ncbi:MAG: SPFH domain-containing protein [Planctomycetota bacterium]|jgi:regulator of protease activity HflC (stomatin/prohibitin superfamily)
MEFLIVPVLVVIAFALAGFRMDREYQRGVIFRLGRFKYVKGPGLYWIIPGIDRQIDSV